MYGCYPEAYPIYSEGPDDTYVGDGKGGRTGDKKRTKPHSDTGLSFLLRKTLRGREKLNGESISSGKKKDRFAVERQ